MHYNSYQKGALNLFQTIVLGVFSFFLIVAFLGLSGAIPLFNGGNSVPGVRGEVTVWGTVKKAYFTDAFTYLNKLNNNLYRVEYVEKEKETFDRELVEALASSVGPDIILLPENLIVRHADKVYPVSYKNLSERTFKDTYIEEGELYMRAGGILALPLAVDPLIMYWNRDLFSSANISSPPKFWDEFFTLGPRVTISDDRSNISRSMIALGEYRNISHAKDIISLLVFQAGNSIIKEVDSRLRVVLQDQLGFAVKPAESALRFFTEFSNPVKPFYSWNRALPASKDFFVNGDLGVYIGFASEAEEIRAKNPHLNFDVAPIPQARDTASKITFGRILGLAVLKQSDNAQTAFYAISQMTGKDFVRLFSAASDLPPARRDLLSEKPGDAFLDVFYQSALTAQSWLDPDPEATSKIYQDMIENVVSGRIRLSDAVARAHSAISALLEK